MFTQGFNGVKHKEDLNLSVQSVKLQHRTSTFSPHFKHCSLALAHRRPTVGLASASGRPTVGLALAWHLFGIGPPLARRQCKQLFWGGLFDITIKFQ